MEMTTMNGQGSGGGYTAGEASSTGFEDFLEMFGARHSSGDLFDLVRKGGAGPGRSSKEVQPTSLPFSSSSSPVALPPSEDDMAAWLYPIISGQEHAVVAGHDDHQPHDDAAGLVAVDDAPADHKRERPPNMQEKCHSGGAEDSTERYSCGSRKKTTGGSTRSHHPAETHNLSEKRRRRKINEKLKTLQRLVPGCDDKSNQASTLDQTIQHIKSLQQLIQVQSLAHTALNNYPNVPFKSFGCDGMIKPPAVYPVVVPPPYLQPPGTAVVAAGGGLLPPAAVAPAVLDRAAARGHVRPGVVLAPPPAMVPNFGRPFPSTGA